MIWKIRTFSPKFKRNCKNWVLLRIFLHPEKHSLKIFEVFYFLFHFFFMKAIMMVSNLYNKFQVIVKGFMNFLLFTLNILSIQKFSFNVKYGFWEHDLSRENFSINLFKYCTESGNHSFSSVSKTPIFRASISNF